MHANEERDDSKEESSLSVKSKDKQTFLEKDYEESDSSSTTSASIASTTIESATTEYPSSMDKVALDLYAFVQQGQNNLIDASSEATDSFSDRTTLSNDEAITDLTATTELSATTLESTTITNAANLATEPVITTTAATTTTSTTTTTTTTTTTEPPTTTTQAPAGRGKFRRPGIGGTNGGTRNR